MRDSAGGARGRRKLAGGRRVRGGGVESVPVRLTRRGRAVLVTVMALLSLGGFWLGTRAAGHADAARPPTNVTLNAVTSGTVALGAVISGTVTQAP